MTGEAGSVISEVTGNGVCLGSTTFRLFNNFGVSGKGVVSKFAICHFQPAKD